MRVVITRQFEVDPKRPRPKWWDDFVGHSFDCENKTTMGWKLSNIGLLELERLRGKKSISALIYNAYGVELK